MISRAGLLLLTALMCIQGAPLPFASPELTVQESKPAEWDGEVQTYAPGKLLSIRKLPQVEVQFDLTKQDTVYSIDTDVRKGSKVHVVERDEAGKHRVSVSAKEKQ